MAVYMDSRGWKYKVMKEGVDEVISLINSRHGVGSFDGDIQRIADEAFKECKFTDEECRHAAWLGFYENFMALLNERTEHRCLNGGICAKEAKEDGAPEGLPLQSDMVNHPSHYTQGKIECIDYIIDKKLGYLLGNAIKYITRCELKNGGVNRVEDLRKAVFYINKQIEMWEAEDGRQ